MVRKLDPTDFRACRLVLDPDDFGLSDGQPDPQPTDLVTEEVWNGIKTLPDDVAVRTTSHQGTRIAILYELWGGWVENFPKGEIISAAMMDAADDFDAALFNLLHGFYKQAIAALRNALEGLTIASCCEITGDRVIQAAWEDGKEIRFREACDKLASSPCFRDLENKACGAARTSIYVGDNGSGRNAWARDLYWRLSRFSHARWDATNASLWNSNGPIYSADGMRLSYYAYIETYALLLLVSKAAASDLKMPVAALVIYEDDSLRQYLAQEFQDLCAFYASELFGLQLNEARTNGEDASSRC